MYVSDDYNVTLTTSEKYGLSSLYLLFCVVIILGNVLTLIAFKVNKQQLLVKYNFSLLSLAVTDLIVGIDCISWLITYSFPLNINNPSSGESLSTKLKGILITSFQVYPVILSGFHVVLIGVERNIAIVHPFFYRTKITSKRLVSYLVFVWLFTFIVTISPALFAVVAHFHLDQEIYVSFVRYFDSYFILCEFVVFLLVVVELICLYASIIWETNCARSSDSRLQSATVNSNEVGSKAWKVSLAIIVIYTVMWIPFFVCSLVLMTTYNPTAFQFRQYTVILGILNSGVNFFIYAGLNKKFRKTYKSIICGCICCNKLVFHNHSSSTTETPLSNELV